jgi:superfamily II DNA or RNA helicase
MVMEALTLSGYEVTCKYTYNKPSYTPVTEDTLSGIKLRDYQVAAANAMLEAGRGVAKMATNSGKTEVMAAVIKAIGQKAIVLVNRKELMYQAAERFKLRGIEDVGIIGDNHFEPATVTVATVQTLINRLDEWFVDDNVVLIADETHHLSSNTMMDIFSKIPGPYRFGVSGTPIKYEELADLKLMAATGQVVYDLSNKELIDRGFSAKPIVDIITIEDNKPDLWDMDYQEAYDALIVHNDIRNKAIADYVKIKTGTVLILVSRLDHGRILQGLIPGSIVVQGSDTTDYRREVIDNMRRKAGVYIASPIFDEGVDVPGVEVVVLAAAGKSQVKLLQRIGRGLRAKVGVNELSVLDFIDDTNKHLLEHSDARVSTYIVEGFETRLRSATG